MLVYKIKCLTLQCSIKQLEYERVYKVLQSAAERID